MPIATTDPPLVLSLETATMGGSVFLGRGSEQLASRNGNAEVSQSTSLLSDINGILLEAGVSLREVNLFACALGPGSFTGLRIGIATLKALASSLNQPCVGIPTLQAIAHAAGVSQATVTLLPAGRGEVFAQMFSVSSEGIVNELDAPAHSSPEKIVARYGAFENLRWAGSGTHQLRDVLESQARRQGIVFAEDSSDTNRDPVEPFGSEWMLAPTELNLARHVAVLALQLFHANKVQSPDSLSAIYVRLSDAELNQPCR